MIIRLIWNWYTKTYRLRSYKMIPISRNCVEYCSEEFLPWWVAWTWCGWSNERRASIRPKRSTRRFRIAEALWCTPVQLVWAQMQQHLSIQVQLPPLLFNSFKMLSDHIGVRLLHLPLGNCLSSFHDSSRCPVACPTPSFLTGSLTTLRYWLICPEQKECQECLTKPEVYRRMGSATSLRGLPVHLKRKIVTNCLLGQSWIDWISIETRKFLGLLYKYNQMHCKLFYQEFE